MIGTVLGRYRIVAKLGEGGMGTVWRAEDPALGRTVALKLLSPALLASQTARERFFREARAASNLDHPGIATVFDVGETEGTAWIASRLIEGESLASKLMSGPLGLPQLLVLARGTADALEHAHASGVCHRDITAGNIMLRPDGTPVIVDFGLARTGADATLTTAGNALGTAGYMAPELWRGVAGNAHSDLWSLGVVMYKAATGVMPFGGESPEAVMYNLLNTEPQRPDRIRTDLPSEFSALVLRLLEKDPRDRTTSASQLASELRALEKPSSDIQIQPRRSGSSAATVRRVLHRMARSLLAPIPVGILLVFAATIAVRVWVVWQRDATTRERVLAVMPMRNTSPDSAETAYIAEGLGQELARRLGDAGGFRILPWSTTGAFPARGHTPTALAQALHANVLLMGSFVVDHDQLQVLVELVDGKTGYQFWSKHYVRPLPELIQLQTELATAVAERVAQSPDTTRSKRIADSAPRNAEAYDSYIRGASYLNSPDESQKALAEAMFRHAIDLEADLAVAWVGLGAVRVDRYYSGNGGGLRDLDAADSCYRRALALDPDLYTAGRGIISLAAEHGDADRSLGVAMAVLQRHPDRSEALETAGWGLTLGGLPEHALPVLKRVLEQDPANASASWYQIIALYESRRDQECVEAGKQYIKRFGEDAEVYFGMGIASTALGRLHDAQLYMERAVELGQPPLGPPKYLAELYKRMSQRDRMVGLLDSTISRYGMMLDAAPDNLHLRCEYASLLALAGESVARDAQTVQILGAFRAGNAAAGGMEPDLPFATAAHGDLDRAREIASALPLDDHTWFGWWLTGSIVERGGYYFGGRIADFLGSVEYQRKRDGFLRYREERLQKFGPIVEKALGS